LILNVEITCVKIIVFAKTNILSQLIKLKCFIFPKIKPGDEVPELSA
jgi:hypothetical protein